MPVNIKCHTFLLFHIFLDMQIAIAINPTLRIAILALIDLAHNHIKDKRIPNPYPQLQGKIEAYNKIVKNEFLALENIPNIDDGKLRYDMFVRAYNEAREHGGISGLTPSEMFLQRLITSARHTMTKQQSVTHVGNQKCNLSM